MIRWFTIAVSFLALGSLAAHAEPAATQVVAQTAVAPAQDACLEHAVRELGMSAKRAEGPGRHWDIASKFLHGRIAKDASASFFVDVTRDDKRAVVQVTAAFASLDEPTQLDVEERLRNIVVKMAQLCGVARPDVACSRTSGGSKPTSCPVPGPVP